MLPTGLDMPGEAYTRPSLDQDHLLGVLESRNISVNLNNVQCPVIGVTACSITDGVYTSY